MTLRDQAIEAMTRAAIRSLYPQMTDEEMAKPAKRWNGTALHDINSSVLDDQKPELEAALDALLTFLAANGLRVVPAEPTNEMLRAACAADEEVEAGNLGRGADLETHWAVMLDAAPNPLAKDAP